MVRRLQPLKTGSLRNQARERIFEAIMSGRLRPGEALQQELRDRGKAASETVFRVLDNLTAPMFAFVTILRSSGHEDWKPGVRAHEPIVEAIRLNNPDRIRVAIREHIENSYQEFLDEDWDNFEILAQSRALLAEIRNNL
jgi:DNA-binding GntR family transcriptional regulator